MMPTLSLSLPFLSDADFSDNVIVVVVPAGSQEFYIPQFFMIVDDDIDEPEQSFAIVAEIENVPESISCFKVTGGSTDCNGRHGATEIKINDRKYGVFHYYALVLMTQPTFLLSWLKK